MAATLLDKIWDAHCVARRADGRDLIYIDRHVVHELHGPHALRKLEAAGRTVRRPDLTVAVTDHTVPTRPSAVRNAGASSYVEAMTSGARRHGLGLIGIDHRDQGIVHVVSPELGIALPGATLACPDSHSCTVGALGTLAFGTGTSELEHVLATQCIALKKPRQMRIALDGRLGAAVTAKDVVLYLIGTVGADAGRGYAVEYCGTVVRELPIEARLTLCNMTIEFGARTGIIAPDETTFSWIDGRRFAPTGEEWETARAYWRTLASDAGAHYDREVSIECGALEPQVTWGTDPSQVIGVSGRVPDPAQAQEDRRAVARRALEYMGLTPGMPIAGLRIDRVFIGSCTNSRLSDLEAAAALARGRRVAKGVTAIVVPGSSTVKRLAEEAGLDQVFRTAGFEWHESGCSMCAGANGDHGEPGERIVSTTNRNFENRQGKGVRTHLASPAMAAAAAIAGWIADVREIAGAEG